MTPAMTVHDYIVTGAFIVGVFALVVTLLYEWWKRSHPEEVQDVQEP